MPEDNRPDRTRRLLGRPMWTFSGAGQDAGSMRIMDVGLRRFRQRSLLVRTILDPTRGRAAHQHPHVEVNLVLAGSATYRLPGGDFPFGPGELLWLPPDTPHRLVHESLPLIMLVGFLERSGGFRASAPSSARIDDREVIEACRRFHQPDGPDAVLAWLMLHRGTPLSPTGQRHPALARALNLARCDPSHASLGSLARAAGRSADHLSELWVRDQGRTVTASCNRLRLLSVVAAWTPGRPLRELAASAGFTTYRRFHRVFTQVAGRSPRSWVRGV
jgi:quercetin dioxygenase-like cupin family protein